MALAETESSGVPNQRATVIGENTDRVCSKVSASQGTCHSSHALSEMGPSKDSEEAQGHDVYRCTPIPGQQQCSRKEQRDPENHLQPADRQPAVTETTSLRPLPISTARPR